MIDDGTLRLRLKRLIIESLHLEGLTPEDIADDGLLFGGDSVSTGGRARTRGRARAGVCDPNPKP